MDSLWRDLHFAFRTLRKSPAYTAVALATLALGIGANSAIFSVVKGVVLNPLPFTDSDELVRVWEVSKSGFVMQSAWRNFVDWRERTERFDDLMAHTSGGPATVLGTGRPLRVGVASVSEGFFATLGVQPVHGRAFLAEEHRFGADPAAVISDAFWRTYLGADPDIASKRLVVSGFDVRVVGVMPRGFEYPGSIDIWYPIELDDQSESRSAHNYVVVGRLKDGVSVEQADAELDAITASFLEDDPGVVNETWFEDYFPLEVRLASLRDALIGDTRRPLAILLGASVLLLMVACTNLASTSLARGINRDRELAVRQSMGAGRGRIARQLFTESLTLALGGAVLGVGLAALTIRALPALAPAGIPRIDEVTLDTAVLGFTLLISILAALLFGLFPAFRASRDSFGAVLRSGTRAGVSQSQKRIWSWLVASEVALALVLLIGSGLLIRSFWTVLSVEPGFRTEGILTATVNPPASKYGDDDAKRRYYDGLLTELETVPGIAEGGLVTRPPLTSVSNGLVDVRGGPRAGVTGYYQLVGGDYFRAMGMTLLRGRPFDPVLDHENAEHVVMVNQAFAKQAWPGDDPIGKQMTGGGMDNFWDQEKWATVIGVVSDVRQRNLTRAPAPTYYFFYRQRPFRAWSMTAILRPQAGSAGALAAPVRNAVRRLDTDVPVTFATIESRVSRAVADRRFTMMVLVFFAAVALILACVGIYGVVAYTVARRSREIGIRIALGADPASVRRLIQRGSLVPVAVGAVVGISLAMALTRVMRSLLYEISPADPLTFVAVLVSVGTAAWLASFIPSLRSTRVNPTVTMRAE